MGNGVLAIQRHINAQGCFLHLTELGFEKKRGSVMVPEDLKGSGWEDFAYNLGKLAGHHSRSTLITSLHDSILEEGSLHPSNEASYAAALSLPARSVSNTVADRYQAMGERLGSVGNLFSRLITVKGDTRASVVGPMLGDVGVLWEVRGHLSGISEEISTLMSKVDWGLSVIIGQGSGKEAAGKAFDEAYDKAGKEATGMGLRRKVLPRLGRKTGSPRGPSGGLRLHLGPEPPPQARASQARGYPCRQPCRHHKNCRWSSSTLSALAARD
ncbi:hypothetical protein F2P56_002755 [Juglans regia]|uniref:Uncharacterized protein n=1 Tax=Juglans regia TaxID=51240 RepID=A0A834DB74_JUGRE|nr:hypothetical protein F2P56_002755 [Juglans regia]